MFFGAIFVPRIAIFVGVYQFQVAFKLAVELFHAQALSFALLGGLLEFFERLLELLLIRLIRCPRLGVG